MSIHTIFATVFIWILFNIVLVLLLVVQIQLRNVLVFLFIDLQRKIQNLKSSGLELLDERIGLLLKQVVCVVSTLIDPVLLRERQIIGFIKMQSHQYFHNFQSTCKNLTLKESLLRSTSWLSPPLLLVICHHKKLLEQLVLIMHIILWLIWTIHILSLKKKQVKLLREKLCRREKHIHNLKDLL